MVANGGKLVATVANWWQTVANWWQTSDFLRFCVLYDLLWWNLGVINTVVENKKGLLYYEYGVFCTENRLLHREQKVFETGFSNRGVRCLSKLRKEQSLDHLGSSGECRAHTGRQVGAEHTLVAWSGLPSLLS